MLIALAWLLQPGPLDLPEDAHAQLEPVTPSQLHVLAVGDIGRLTETQREVADTAAGVCAAHGCDLAVFLGDNLYERGMETPDDPRIDALFEPYADIGIPLYLVLGNHDYGHGRDAERAAWQIDWAARTPQIELPATTYTLDAGIVSFVALDTTRVFWEGATAQASWLDEQLQVPTSGWRVGLGHHGYLSEGRHGNAGRYEGIPAVPYLSGRSLERLFSDHVCDQLDVWISGHDHILQWIEHCGTHWITSGSGAKATDIVGRGNEPRFASDHPGFAWLAFTDETLTVRFIDAQGTTLFEQTVLKPR